MTSPAADASRVEQQREVAAHLRVARDLAIARRRRLGARPARPGRAIEERDGARRARTPPRVSGWSSPERADRPSPTRSSPTWPRVEVRLGARRRRNVGGIAELGESALGDALRPEEDRDVAPLPERGARSQSIQSATACTARPAARPRAAAANDAADLEDAQRARPGARGCCARRAAAMRTSVRAQRRPASAGSGSATRTHARRGSSAGRRSASSSPASTKRERHQLDEAGSAQSASRARIAQRRAPRRHRRSPASAAGRQRRRDRVVAVDARDLLDQVLGNREVGAPARRPAAQQRPRRRSRRRRRRARAASTSSPARERVPSRRFTRAGSSAISAARGAPRRAPRRRPARTFPPASSASSRAARSAARATPSGSTPRSKRYDASLWRPRRRAVRRTAGRLELRALDQHVRRGVGVTSLSAPPITPAIAIARSASAITRSASASARVLRRRASRASRRGARARTRISPPRSLARSKACSGWPSSSITRFVTSTTLLIDAEARALRAVARSHAGEGADRRRRARCAPT